MNANAFLPPPAISPIATASEEHETNNDNQNKIHVLLQNMSRRDCPPACGCGITTPLASESTYFNASGESKTGAKKRLPEPRVAACFPCRPAQRVHPNRRTLLDRDRAVPASGGDTHARPVAGAALQLVGCHLLHKLAIRSLDLTSPSSLPIFLPLPRDTGMKVVNSLKSLEKRDKNCRIVRRMGCIYVINKPIPGSKPARADPGARLHDQLS